MITLYSQKGEKKCDIHKFKYTGTFLGECFITATINAPEPINFEIDDYCIFRGESFILSSIPAKEKRARKGTHGEAFVYDSIKFNSLADELNRVEFKDVVLYDNGIHGTSVSEFTFFAEHAQDLVNRIQANLDRVYVGDRKWTVKLSPDVKSKSQSISVSKIKVTEALKIFKDKYNLNFIIRNREITVGTSGLAVGKVFGYGLGNGLYDIQQTTNQEDSIITRLYAYGSTKNMPNRYYNQLKDEHGKPYISESLWLPNLMLPDFPRIENDPQKVYIDSPNKVKYGIREGSIYFDQDDNEIFPTIEEMTADNLRAEGIIVSLPVNDNGKLDLCLGADNPNDNGLVPEKGQGKIAGTFTLYLKDLGFDLSAKDKNGDYQYQIAGRNVEITMKDGACSGRTFAVVDKGITKERINGYVRYKVECNRFIDDSIDGGTAFPNNYFQVKAGDRFVITGIVLPDVYVQSASERLMSEACKYLSDHDSTKFSYTPKIDEIFMAEHPDLGESIKEGDIFSFSDSDLEIDASEIIQTLSINVGDGLIPTYEVTLCNDRIKTTVEKIQNSIEALSSNNTGITIDQVKSLIQSIGTKYFLSRLEDDNANGNINFMQNVSIVKDLLVKHNITSQGLIISDVFQNSTYTAGQFGSGFQVKRDTNGQSYMEVDNLLVRREALFTTITIGELKSLNMGVIISLADMTVSQVKDKGNTWRCYFNTDEDKIRNKFVAGDQAICRKEDGNNIRYYWALVTTVGADYIELSKDDKDGSGSPAINDVIIQLGNRTDVNRQNAIILSAYGSDAPSIKQYAGINSYDLTGKEITVISPTGNRFTGKFIVSTNGTTAPVYKEVGKFENGRVYYKNDRVTHLGSFWVCIADNTIQTPNEDSVFWRKETAGVTDINKAIKNIHIGGENLFLNSSFNELKGWNAESVSDWSIAGTSPFNSSCKVIGWTGAGWYQRLNAYTWDDAADVFQAGVTYTVSFYGRADGELFMNFGAENLSTTRITLTNDWQLFSHTFIGDGKSTTIVFYGSGNWEVRKYMTMPMLVIGNKSADWSPSSKDLQNSIEVVETEFNSNLNVLNDKISSKVEQSDFNALGDRVSHSESRIEQQSDKIQSTIEKVDGLKNLQAEISTKSRTYYQDNEPSVPDGGHSIGDIWLKKSLVDYDGNINADIERNIYQLQYRWNGSTWERINWYATRSAVKQTESGIQLLTEKTGIDSLGSGETLKSLIDQTPDKISLAVKNIHIGGENLFLNSSFNELKGWNAESVSDWSIAGTSPFNSSCKVIGWTGAGWYQRLNAYTWDDAADVFQAGVTYTVSFYGRADGELFMNFGAENLSTTRITLTNDWQLFSHTFIGDGKSTTIVFYGSGNWEVRKYMTMPMLVIGNKSADWSPSSKDTKTEAITEIASSFEIDKNEIRLASKKIVLSGDTIAEAIEAKELKIGDRNTSPSALEVSRTGKFYSKGSDGDSALIIDSDARQILLESMIAAPGENEHDPHARMIKQVMKMDAKTGTFEVRNQAGDVSKLTSEGIFSNVAGLNPFPAGYIMRASVTGLASADLEIGALPDTTLGVVGVYGRASNTSKNPAPTYGGYFEMLNANGLCLNTRRITSDAILTYSDVIVACYNKSDCSVTLPASPYNGRIIYVRMVNSYSVTVKTLSDDILVRNKLQDSIVIGKDAGEGAMFIWDGLHWLYNYIQR